MKFIYCRLGKFGALLVSGSFGDASESCLAKESLGLLWHSDLRSPHIERRAGSDNVASNSVASAVAYEVCNLLESEHNRVSIRASCYYAQSACEIGV